MASEQPGAVLKIRNDSESPYEVEELGGVVMAPGEELDLMDDSLSVHYDNWDAARSLVDSVTSAKLYQDVQSGVITVVESTAPSMPQLPSSGPAGTTF